MANDGALLRVEGLKKHFPLARGLFTPARNFVHAVDGVSFHIGRGEVLGLVGESGSGKTTLGRLLTKLEEPSAGHIYFRSDGDSYLELGTLKGRSLKWFRRHVQMVFQDPYQSMNPRKTVYDTVAEPLVVQGIGSPWQRQEQAAKALALVGLTPAASFLLRHPHELSGGQRQRAALARALILGPSLIIADEPTSMLDVSVRIGVMNLMLELSWRLGISYLYITHDLAVARYMCHRIAVMYRGKIVEMAEAEELLRYPLHPYTQALISAVPVPVPGATSEDLGLRGSLARPVDAPPHCRFYDRCPLATDPCRTAEHPPLEEKAPGHYVACCQVAPALAISRVN
ncbi:MAG: ABC transporter ATP-binding protein [Dehalococcoidia bacterium]